MNIGTDYSGTLNKAPPPSQEENRNAVIISTEKGTTSLLYIRKRTTFPYLTTMCPLFRGSTVHKEEDYLSIADPNVSFIQRFYCT